MFPATVTKNMQTTLAEWYPTVARHHLEGAGPSLNDIQGDCQVILARMFVDFAIFGGAKPLPGAPVGPFMEKTQVFWVQKDGLELSN